MNIPHALMAFRLFSDQRMRFLHRDCQIDLIGSILGSLKYRFLTGKDLYVANRVLITNPSSIITGGGSLKIGLNDFSLATARDKTSIILRPTSRLQIEGDVEIGRGCRIALAENAILKIGNGSYITGLSNVVCTKSIEIGEWCAISWGVLLLDNDFHAIGSSSAETIAKPLLSGEPAGGIAIGNHVLIGSNVTILKNVSIGDGCIIGANSVVRQDIPARCMAIGNPAAIVRRDVDWR